MPTDEEIVKAKYPDARCWEHYPDDWQVAVGTSEETRLLSIRAKNKESAWADAARRIKQEDRNGNG